MNNSQTRNERGTAMDENTYQFGVGEAIGTEVADHLDRHSARYCASERQRIETVNRPAILALQAQVAHLRVQERDLEERMYHAIPPHAALSRKRKAIFRYLIAFLLTVAGFVFAVLAFEPYRLGWKAWLYCLGISIVTPFLVDRILDRWASDGLVNVLTTAAGVVAVGSLIALAEIRGDILAEQIKSTPSAVVEDADQDQPAAPATTFYDRTGGLLRLVMALLAFAIEVGSGIAVHEANHIASEGGEDGSILRGELQGVRERMIVHGHQIWALENAGAAFEHEYWRDFYRSLLNGVKRGAIQKLLLMLLVASLLGHAETTPPSHIDLTILLDLSRSETVRGHEGKEEFAKNVQSITKIMSALPPGSKVSVVGITDDSFGTPLVILSGELGDDEGYFHERLAQGRTSLVHAWRKKSEPLTPSYKTTDILGSLLVASETLHQDPDNDQKMLVILSDMKQATTALNLENRRALSAPALLKQVKRAMPVADLHGVHVFVEGVDGAGETLAYWNDLREFWREYFALSGATLERYTVLRDIPSFISSSPAPAENHRK
jgi:hypothetical protein